MHCQGCGHVRDMLWQAGSDRDGRGLFICEECIREPENRSVPTGVVLGYD